MKFSPYPCPNHSPWDAVQYKHEIGPGLWAVSTPGHGGVFMSPERLRHFRSLFPTFEGYAGLPWLEEDMDCNLAPLAFPEDYTPESIFYAVESVLTYKSSFEGDQFYFCQPRDWLLSSAGDELRKIAETYSASRAGLWRRGGCGSSREPRGWDTFWSRGAERAITFTKDYITENWWTDEQIKANPPMAKPQPKPVSVCQTTLNLKFNENDCGGVFTGSGVVSDADPGL
jgi:hypothetical protein